VSREHTVLVHAPGPSAAFWSPLVRGGPAGNSGWQEQVALLVGTSDGHTRRNATAAGTERTASSRV
jgi:hypothetical protein